MIRALSLYKAELSGIRAIQRFLQSHFRGVSRLLGVRLRKGEAFVRQYLVLAFRDLKLLRLRPVSTSCCGRFAADGSRS
jgi:hypothetical protein